MDVAAPGVDIMSTVAVGQGPGSHPNYDVWDGTSMASPFAAGVAGVVLSEHPGYSAAQLKNAVMRSVDHPASLKLYNAWAAKTHVGKKLLSGHFTRTQGRVNAFKALSAGTSNATPPSDGNIDGAKAIGSVRSGSLAWPADDNDVYRKRLTKGDIYQVTLDVPKGGDMDLWVWRPGTNEIFQFTSGCFASSGACPALAAFSAKLHSADEQVRFRAPKTGIYYIQVNGWYAGGHYKLTVKRG